VCKDGIACVHRVTFSAYLPEAGKKKPRNAASREVKVS
jgi:hypothetical protein